MPTNFLLTKKIQREVLKLNKLEVLIFGNVKFWRPIQAEDVDAVVSFESFRALKVTLFESFRVLKNYDPI